MGGWREARLRLCDVYVGAPVSAGRLDLRAVDRFIENREELRRPHDSTLDVVAPLLAHCRALREASRGLIIWLGSTRALHEEYPPVVAMVEKVATVLQEAVDGRGAGGGR